MGTNDILGTLGDLAGRVVGAIKNDDDNPKPENGGDNPKPENGGDNPNPENGGDNPKPENEGGACVCDPQPENGGEPAKPKKDGQTPKPKKDGEPAKPENGGEPAKPEKDGEPAKPEKNDEPDKPDNKDQQEKADKKDEVSATLKEVNETINAFGNLIDAAKKQDATLTLTEVCAPTKLGEEAFHQLESLDMSKLIGAPINAAIDAHYNAARKALECINQMGVKDGTLAVVTFNFFRNGKIAKMSIPLLTLVPIATMRIKEMTYDFKVKINTDSSINLVTGNENTFSYGVGLNNGKKETPAAAAQPDKAQAKPQEGQKPATDKAAQKEGEAKGENAAKGGKEAEAAGKGKSEGEQGGKPVLDATSTAVKNAARVEPTFGVSFSSKKDSKATQNSKYSVETSMDIKLTVVSDENIPAGVSRMLEILNNAVEVYNPKGELTVSTNKVKIADDFAVVSVVYMDCDGCLALEKVSCKCITGKSVPTILNGGDQVQILFDTPGTYIVGAGGLQSPVIVEK